jgi:hypothetical protein
MDWLRWAPLGAASLHIIEEFVLPGGFAAWYRRYRLDASRITTRFLVIINAALLVMCCDVALLGRTPLGIAYWLAISSLLGSNGCWHAWASYRQRGYSPGVITGMTIHVPLAVYGYVEFLRSGAASIRTALIAGMIGSTYPIWSAAYHRKRTKKG